MPVAIIDIPCLAWSAKEQLHKDVAESMHHAYQMPDNRVYLREWTAEQTSFDGVVGASFRPLCNLIVPPILTAESRKMLASRVSSAIHRACDLRPEVVPLPSGEQVSTRWVRSSTRFRSSKPRSTASWRSRTQWCPRTSTDVARPYGRRCCSFDDMCAKYRMDCQAEISAEGYRTCREACVPIQSEIQG